MLESMAATLHAGGYSAAGRCWLGTGIFLPALRLVLTSLLRGGGGSGKVACGTAAVQGQGQQDLLDPGRLLLSQAPARRQQPLTRRLRSHGQQHGLWSEAVGQERSAQGFGDSAAGCTSA